MPEMETKATIVVYSAKMKVGYIAVQSDWFAEYVEEGMRSKYEYFIADTSCHYRKITYLGCETADISVTLEEL